MHREISDKNLKKYTYFQNQSLHMEVNNKANLNNAFKISEQIINIHNW